jgi:chloride channel protein, CIC family
MKMDISEPASRLRAMISRALTRLGFRDDSFLVILAVIIGMLAAAAAVGFHELILWVRDSLYLTIGEQRLYGRWIVLLILFPAGGGLLVGLISRFVFRARMGHGVEDVVESVIRTSGFQRPATAIEKILTAAITIGSGGSAGAEGPIVQIGASIASGVGQLFRITRQHMPTLIGCGSAAGISAIFNAPFGGVLFTLEVILQDFSIRAFTPVVVASVIAQVSELLLFKVIHKETEFHPIFGISPDLVTLHEALHWGDVGNFVVLGVLCGLLGVALIRLTDSSERFFERLPMGRPLKPALGGALMGLLGVGYVLIFGRMFLHVPKPVPFQTYPMPAFYGDGYGFIEQLISPKYQGYLPGGEKILILLAFLCIIKLVATCLTLCSGGSGGIIAPSLFIGSTAGAVVGAIFHKWSPSIQPDMFALVGMGAVLAAVVHAPLASILIVFEVTEDYKVMVPAMLTCIVATGIARMIERDSIYTMGLRRRGLRVGSGADLTLLRRMNVEQVTLEPASIVRATDPFQKIMELAAVSGAGNFVVADEQGNYQGMVISEDWQTALLARDAVPLLVVSEVMRTDVPVVKNTDDLAAVLESFAMHELSHLPVTISGNSKRVIGMISRAALMRAYQESLAGPV